MSPAAGDLLVEHIAPRLRATIPKVVHPVGAEDAEELVQDAIVVAAQMLDSVERHGKTVTAGNIAYYAILAMKSGRRSQCRSRADVMAQGTQLDHRSAVLSFEEEVGYDPELDEPVTLGELLTTDREDPAMAAARNADWEQFLGSHDGRYGVLVKGIAEGKTAAETAAGAEAGFSRIYQLKYQLADELRAFMGDGAVADAVRIPPWRGNLMADREKTACRATRRRG
jgi:DNA-directed RNA polymerase specialized sigma24 family protein